MAPKRRARAGKPGRKTSSPAAIRPSSLPKRRNSLQGGKMSRLAPSEPLHMTTRRAAKSASNNTSSGAPSLASSDSRRSSLDDAAHYQNAHSDGEQDARPTKRPRLSTGSGSPPMSSNASCADNTTPVNGTQTPHEQLPAPSAAAPPPTSAARKRRVSDDSSSQSSKTVSAHPNGLLTRTQSDLSEPAPRRKKRKTTETPAEPSEQPPDLTDASTAPNSPEQVVDSSQSLQHVLPTNGDAPAKPGRRLPGRRRQPHSDMNVEVALRRQLNLKMSYRSVAKVQKLILDELSNRTTSSLDGEPDFHKQCPEYKHVMASLDAYKQQRLAQIGAERAQKLDQLERVNTAEVQIQKQQYINRFLEMQDDMLLQCYIRMKQIERQWKGSHEDVTDDEDNLVEPAYLDEPLPEFDDRVSSRFASRSRAYVEAENMLGEEAHRRKFDELRKTFVEATEEADDSVGDYARFAGPDRAEANAHYQLTKLLDAAEEVDRTPEIPKVQVPQTIPNEQADALLLLASLSADRSQHAPVVQQGPAVAPPAQAATPPLKTEADIKQQSPVASIAVAAEAPKPSSAQAPQTQGDSLQPTPHKETNDGPIESEPEAPKNATPARLSTHRIMDLLNTDQDVPVSKTRASLPHPLSHEQAPGTAPRPEPSNQTPLSTLQGQAPRDPFTRSLADASTTCRESPSSPHFSRSSFAPRPVSEEALRRKDPQERLRAMLERRERVMGRPPGGERADGAESMRREKERLEQERAQMPAPPLAQSYSPQGSHDRPGASERESGRPALAAYTASPSNPPLPYSDSPRSAPALPPAPRPSSQDQVASYGERDRRPSASQPPSASPYSASAQPYQGDAQQTGPTPPPRHSPYAPPQGPQLPSLSSTLPPKPTGPPSGPVNFRFAHYDPAPPPPRTAYPSSSTSYSSASHTSPHGGHHPVLQYSSGPGYSAPPNPQQYPAPGGYVPPPGSFQAPPPPPLPPAHSQQEYPPLKIHQYGGQPILPANMAPPPHSHSHTHSHGHAHSQSQQQHMSYASGQTAVVGAPSAYSPPMRYEPPRDSAVSSTAERPPEPQARPRRQYRSYAAPGTQFRSYQGPDAARRRGG